MNRTVDNDNNRNTVRSNVVADATADDGGSVDFLFIVVDNDTKGCSVQPMELFLVLTVGCKVVMTVHYWCHFN